MSNRIKSLLLFVVGLLLAFATQDIFYYHITNVIVARIVWIVSILILITSVYFASTSIKNKEVGSGGAKITIAASIVLILFELLAISLSLCENSCGWS